MPGCGPAERAWIEEINVMYNSRIKIYSHCLAFAAQARLSSVESFMDVMESVLVFISLSLGETLRGTTARLVWMREHVREHGYGSAERCIMDFTSLKVAPVIDALTMPFHALTVDDRAVSAEL